MTKKKSIVSLGTIIVLAIVGAVLLVLYLVYMAIKKATDTATKAANDIGAIPGNIVKGVSDAAGAAGKQMGTGAQAATITCGTGTTKVQNSDGSVFCKPNEQSAIAVPTSKCPDGQTMQFVGENGSASYWHCVNTPGMNTSQTQQQVMGSMAGSSGTFYNSYTNTVQQANPGQIYNLDDHAVMIDWRLRWARLHPGTLVCDIKVRDLFQCVWDCTGDGRVQWRGQIYTRTNWMNAPGLSDPATFGSGDQDYLIAQASKTQGNRLVPWF